MTSEQQAGGSRAAVFLDRDGVIIENRADYVKSWDEVVILPGALAALARLAQSDYRVVIITNQSAVGRGRLTLETLAQIHDRLLVEIHAAGGRVDGVYYCPHAPEDHCGCRKPQPGMLLRAAQELELDLNRSFLIGDAASDVEAAIRAGCQPVLVLTGRGKAQRSKCAPCEVAEDLEKAVEKIIREEFTAKAQR